MVLSSECIPSFKNVFFRISSQSDDLIGLNRINSVEYLDKQKWQVFIE